MGRDAIGVCVERSVDEKVVLAVLCAGTFLAPLDSSIVNIALPSIAADLGARITATGWVATAYVLTTASLVLAMGRIADIWGLRRVYVAGFLFFGVGSAASALSPSLAFLIAARVLQACGAAAMFASGPALVTKTFSTRRRGWALGWISLAVSAGLTTGPAIGGILVGTFGWRSVFVINIPLSILMAALARRLLPEDCPDAEPFDVAGAVLAATALTAGLVALSEIDRSGLVSIGVLGPLIVSVAAAIAFVRLERRIDHPMLDLGLFSERRFSAGVGAAVLSYASLFAVTFTMPFYLLTARGMDARVAGLVLTATPVSMAVFSPIAGRLSDRHGSRGLSTFGLAWLSLSLAAMAFLQVETPLLIVAVGLFCVGTGLSLFQAPNTAAILRAVPRSRAGVGSALVGQARNLGMALGIGITAAVVAMGLRGADLMSLGRALTGAEAALFVEAMRPALFVGAALAALGSLVSWVRGPDGYPEDMVDAGAVGRVDSSA